MGRVETVRLRLLSQPKAYRGEATEERCLSEIISLSKQNDPSHLI